MTEGKLNKVEFHYICLLTSWPDQSGGIHARQAPKYTGCEFHSFGMKHDIQIWKKKIVMQ